MSAAGLTSKAGQVPIGTGVCGVMDAFISEPTAGAGGVDPETMTGETGAGKVDPEATTGETDAVHVTNGEGD